MLHRRAAVELACRRVIVGEGKAGLKEDLNRAVNLKRGHAKKSDRNMSVIAVK
jgi:hypothetical protein